MGKLAGEKLSTRGPLLGRQLVEDLQFVAVGVMKVRAD